MAENLKDVQGQSGATQFADGDFASLLQKEFKPKSDAARDAVEDAVRTLAEQALAETTLVSSDVLQTIEGMIAALDRKLTEQINLILHNSEFQALEGAWRGLHYLVSNTESDEMLKVRVMNISKNELHKTLKKYKGTAWDQSPIFKKIYEEEYGQLGGEPFGCLVADYYFGNSAPDVELLSMMGQVCAAAHAPLITGADPSVMLMDSWRELANPRDLTKIFQTPQHAAWRSLRESDDSRYIGLAMPRFLSRAPYGATTNPVDDFDFEEDTAGGSATHYAWSNAAYAMAVNINRSFKEYGWCSRIGSLRENKGDPRTPLSDAKTGRAACTRWWSRGWSAESAWLSYGRSPRERRRKPPRTRSAARNRARHRCRKRSRARCQVRESGPFR